MTRTRFNDNGLLPLTAPTGVLAALLAVHPETIRNWRYGRVRRPWHRNRRKLRALAQIEAIRP